MNQILSCQLVFYYTIKWVKEPHYGEKSFITSRSLVAQVLVGALTLERYGTEAGAI
jgi:hypothetical protein